MLSGVGIGALMAVGTNYIGEVRVLTCDIKLDLINSLGRPIEATRAHSDWLGSLRHLRTRLGIGCSTDLRTCCGRVCFPNCIRYPVGCWYACSICIGCCSGVSNSLPSTVNKPKTTLTRHIRSPARLISKGKFDAARKDMKQIYGSNNSPDGRYGHLKYTIQMELEQQSNKSCNYCNCLRGRNLQRTMTVAFLYSTSNIAGAPLLAQNIYFLISIQAATLQGAGWPIAAEIPLYHLRSKTVSIGLFAQTGTAWLFTFVTPYMYNVDSSNLGAKTAFIYAGTTVFLVGCAWKLIPDTTGLSTAEIDAA